MSRLHAKQLRLLIAIEESGSLLGAADKVGLTQPGASKALRELEVTLKVALFKRTNRGLIPTEAGYCALRFARLIQSDIDNLRFELEAIASGAGGHLALGTIMGAAPLLSDAVSSLLERQPHMSVEIVEDTSETLLGLIERGRLDAAICRSSVGRNPGVYESLFVKDETLAAIANVGHPAMSAKAVELRALQDSRWVVYRAQMPMRRLLEREFHEAQLRFPQHLIETTSALTTLAMLRRNTNLVALVSDDVANYFSRNGLVGILALTLKSRSEPYELVMRKGAPKSPALMLLMEVLKLRAS
ncbi:LysR family transcriptional regulator [Variovorax ginsengisoli]|uniref:DNA-binding transcriptional LysR family regulator n=1 Tax=Variovorax ginsengisoli TaxID=363844 RepID=A0ABT9S8U9_9BURK|nr:LysR family transcriptional regulator [Variovorax ginsengisoli]MDP9900779.1 DNA-binding transcriptional LysR family regulator [Variovorax ginsengisoli]